ncbi:MAG: site-2 protease family protein, partial [Myxococcota bacterium]
MEPIRFRLFRFTIQVNFGFLLFLGVLAILRLPTQPVAAVVAFLLAVTLSLVVHELGHAFVARSFGLKVMPIELSFMHGVTPHQSTTPGRQLGITLAGPGAGFVLAALAMGAGLIADQVRMSHQSVVYELIDALVYVNIVYGLFNLLPIWPLDGGNALRSSVALVWGSAVAWKVTAVVGAVGALALVLFGFTTGETLLATLFGFIAYQNIRMLQ